MLPDILVRVHSNFEESDRSMVMEMLQTYMGPEPDRVRRCVLHLADGDAAKVRYFIEAAGADYRDVIYWAEYDSNDRRLRDYSRPFE